MKRTLSAVAVVLLACLLSGRPLDLPAVQSGDKSYVTVDSNLLKGLQYRSLGFSRGGRATAVAGIPDKPLTYYFGSTGGGVWKTNDAGITWTNVSDGFFEIGSIGAIAVADSDPNVVYVGTGSACPRGNISPGGGVYKSTDAGKTWKHVGLKEAGQIGRIRVHPKDHNLVYVAALGHLFGPNEERGVFRSKDGGKTWEKVLFVSAKTGAVDLSMDPNNPRIIFAAMWTAERKPWTIISGGEESGLYKTTDGGKTYQSISVSHGDNHDLWINPTDSKKMINSNDGGANVSLNGGTSWTGQMNQPTAEIYRVTVDNQFPHRIYGAQQDNSTASVPSRAGFGEAQSFYSVGGGESGHIAVDPRNPNIVYAGSYGGTITRMDASTRLARSVMAYPESATGQRAADLKYRFQWNAPILISPHDPDVVYHTSQHVHRTRDGGHSWEVISPDLTRNDKSRQDYSGGPISRDNTGVEVFATIFAFVESPLIKGLLWAGSDDGLVHISRDDGANWKNVTPAGMPDFGTVNMIDVSAHDPGRAFIAAHRYRLDDFKPFIFRTNNYGQSWDLLTDGQNGIPFNHFVRVVREDPDRKGLLYAGTEFGMYISLDDGAHWRPLQLNLPITPITDLAVYRKDLVVATQGRAFWMLDDLTPLHQINDTVAKSRAYLFAPRQAYRAPGHTALIQYYFAEEPKETVTLEIMDAKGKVIQTYSSKPQDTAETGTQPEETEESPFARLAGDRRVPTRAGMNRFAWNLAYPAIFTIPPRTVMWGGGGRTGPKALPGAYQVRLKMGDWSQTQSLQIAKDPRINTTQAEFEEQFDLANRIGEKVKELYDSLLNLRDVRKQAIDLADRLEKAGHGKDATQAAKALGEKLTMTEGDLTQLQGEGGQDALNFPGRMDNQLVTLYNEVAGPDGRPTAGSRTRFEDLKPQLARLLDQLKKVLDTDLGSFNQLVRGKGVPPVIMLKETSQK